VSPIVIVISSFSISLSQHADDTRVLSHHHWHEQRSEGSLEVIDLFNFYIQPSEIVCCLGVVIENMLSFDAHVNSVCNAVYYHAKALRHIWKRVTTDVTLTIASTMVSARLDYCNDFVFHSLYCLTGEPILQCPWLQHFNTLFILPYFPVIVHVSAPYNMICNILKINIVTVVNLLLQNEIASYQYPPIIKYILKKLLTYYYFLYLFIYSF